MWQQLFLIIAISTVWDVQLMGRKLSRLNI